MKKKTKTAAHEKHNDQNKNVIAHTCLWAYDEEIEKNDKKNDPERNENDDDDNNDNDDDDDDAEQKNAFKKARTYTRIKHTHTHIHNRIHT